MRWIEYSNCDVVIAGALYKYLTEITMEIEIAE